MTIDHKLIWNETKDYIFITLGLMLYTFGWTVFLLPYQIVTGGVTGISAIIFYATGLPPLNTVTSSSTPHSSPWHSRCSD